MLYLRDSNIYAIMIFLKIASDLNFDFIKQHSDIC
jgi:hypothetical protein